MRNNNLVSIIIPTWNRKKEISKCLESVFQQIYPNKEVIVIDNGSRDDTKEMLDQYFSKARVVYNSKNKGAAYAKNQGIAKARGDFIWFLDSDSIILHDTCLSTMIDLWRKYRNIGALGGEIILNNNDVIIGMRVYNFYENGMSYIKNYSVKDSLKGRGVGFLPTFNLFTSKEILYQVGGFDPYYFYLAEDKELCFKIKKLGYRIISNIKTSILHDRKELYSQRLKKNKYSYDLHKNRIRFILINYNFKEIIQLPILDFVKNKGFVINAIGDIVILIGAYLRNIIFSPREILIKYTKPNFLKKIK